MNQTPENLAEQLSAYMDGELSDEQARFLQRRLEHDLELRRKWQRLQVAASCMKGQPWLPARSGLGEGVQAALAASAAAASPSRRPLAGWAVAASLAALAVVFGPRLMPAADTAPTMADASRPAQARLVPSPGAADLVSDPGQDLAGAAPVQGSAISGPDAAIIASTQPPQSPLSLAQSPTEFPLVEGEQKASWPRSGLPGVPDDPALEAYLVRHNQMLANDGLGGFVPYVDVLARDPAVDSSAGGGDGDVQP